MALHPQIVEVTARVRERSAAPRARYLAHVAAAQVRGSARGRVSCTNLAHAIAASPSDDKTALRGSGWPNLAIVSAYNDIDRKSTRLNSRSLMRISYAVFCLTKKKKNKYHTIQLLRTEI